MEKIKVNEGETAHLIRLADRRAVQFAFGPSFVALEDVPGNEWAIEALREFRESKIQDGRSPEIS